MKIKNICNSCKREVGESVATLSSPPQDGVSVKFHLCRFCYKEIEKKLI
jgi:ribosomal protein S14